MITRLLLILTSMIVMADLYGQPTILPAPVQDARVVIKNATIHIGNGEILKHGTLAFESGKITYVGPETEFTRASEEVVIDGTGKHLYPGFIAPNTTLGLVEFSSVRATIDFAEVGENNAHVRSLIAYNTDSKVINTLRSNGILLAQITPQRGLVSGQSSVVQLDAWNWEDAAYQADGGMHVNWPEWRVSRRGSTEGLDARRSESSVQVNEFVNYLQQARAYLELKEPKVKNARFEAFRGIFSGEKRLFIHVDQASGIVDAISKCRGLGITPVIVGARDAHLVLPQLKENNVPVVLRSAHSLPSHTDDDVNLPFKQAKLLHDAGILAAYSIDGFWEVRNLPFIAGTGAAFGLDKEVALQYITLNTAKILGIEERTGSLEVGKDANLFLSAGDALDMRGNNVMAAFIQGRNINLDDFHKQLFERYKMRYGIKESRDQE